MSVCRQVKVKLNEESDDESVASSQTFCLLRSLSFVLHLFFYTMGDIRIGNLNMNGARDDGKRLSLFKLCSLKKLDVILVYVASFKCD